MFSVRRLTSPMSVALLLFVAAACGDASAPGFTPPAHADVLNKVTLSDRSLIMAVDETATLRLSAENFEGAPMVIPDSVPVRWESSNPRVLTVDANGNLRAVAATSPDEYVLAIGTWTYRAVTKADTSFISVTATQQPIARIQMVPRDSTRSSKGENLFVTGSGVSIFALDSSDARLFSPRVQVFATGVGPTPGIVAGVYYAYLGQFGVTLGFGQYLLFTTYIGDYWLTARTRVYGTMMGDSVRFTGLYPPDVRIQMQKDSASNTIVSKFSGYEAFVQPCGSAIFENQSGQPIDVVFDDPAKASGCVPGDPTGNIANIPQGGSVARKFPNTGSVQWTVRSTATGAPLPRLSGTVTMKVP